MTVFMTIPRYELSLSVVTFVSIIEYMVYTFNWKTRIWKISVRYYELGRGGGSSISRCGCISYCLEKCSDQCLEDPHSPVEQRFQRDHHTMSQNHMWVKFLDRALKSNGVSCNSTNSLLISCQIPCCNNSWALTVEGLPRSSDLQLKSL